MNSQAWNIVLIDDNEGNYQALGHLFSTIEGVAFTLDWAATYEAALAAISQQQHDGYLVNAQASRWDGLKLLAEAAQVNQQGPLVWLTDQANLEGDLAAIRAGATFCLTKDWLDGPNLVYSLRCAIERASIIKGLQQQEIQYRQLVELSPDAFIVHQYGQIIFCNSAAVTLLGASRLDQLVDRPLENFVHPDYHHIVQARIKQITKEGQPLELIEEKFIRLDGQVIDVEAAAALITYQGQPAIQSIIRDISPRKQLEEILRNRAAELEEARSFLTTIIDHVPSPLFVKDAQDLRFIHFNKANEALHGLDRKNIIGKNDYDLSPQDEADYFTAKDREVLQEIRVVDIPEEAVHTLNRGVRLLHTQKVPILGPDGQTKYLLGISEDITERKQLEQQVQASLEYRTRQVQLSTEVAQAIAAAPAMASLFQRVVNLVRERFGYYHVQVYTVASPLELPAQQNQLEGNMLVLQESTGEVGHMLKTIDHKIPLSAEKSLVVYAARTGEAVLAPDVFRESHWLPNALLPETRAEIAVPIKLGQQVLGVLDVQNATIGSLSPEDQLLLTGLCGQIAIAIDHRRAEEWLRASETKLAQAQQIAHVGNWEWHIQTSSLQWSDEVYRIMGLDPQTFGPVDHETFHTLVHPDDNDLMHELVATAIAHNQPYSFDHRIVQPTGQIRVVHEEARVIYNTQGQAVRMVGTVQDITERKGAENALREYSERLEEMVAERTAALEAAQERLVRQERLAVLGQLAGGVAHELRNPLGVIANAVYFLNMVLSEADATVIEYLDIIANRVREAEKIVAALLNLSRTQAADREMVNLLDLVHEVLVNYSPSETIQVNLHLPLNPPLVYIDPQQIQQVLTNLITNAYQAMPNGGKLNISATAQAQQMQLSISDTGCGMSAEVMAKIFEPLFTTKARGIGLGLAVSKNLIDVNKGKIEVSSREGEGSTFVISLPTQRGG